MRSSRQNVGDLKLMFCWVNLISFFQCLSIMNFECNCEIKGRIVFIFFTLSLRAVKAFQLLISLFCGFCGLVSLVCMSLISCIRFSVSILSQRVDFHASNCMSTRAIRSHKYLRDLSSFLQSLSCL
jgi:hypothetical protein